MKPNKLTYGIGKLSNISEKKVTFDYGINGQNETLKEHLNVII